MLPVPARGRVWRRRWTAGAGKCYNIGGFKQSGVGREMGFEAIDLYTEMKSVRFTPGWEAR